MERSKVFRIAARTGKLLAFLTAAAVGLAGLRAYRVTRNACFVPAPAPGEPPHRLPHTIPVEFPSDGMMVRGWYVPAQNRAAVILVHGTFGTRADMLEEAALLADSGFGAVLLDLPGQGASDGKITWGAKEATAISGAVSWLLQRAEIDPSRIGAYGFSLGGYIVVRAAANDPRIQTVAVASSPESLPNHMRYMQRQSGAIGFWAARLAFLQSGTDPMQNVAGDLVSKLSPRPILVMAGEADTLVPLSMTRRLFDRATSPKEFRSFPGAGHGDYRGEHQPQFRNTLVSFFERTLLQQGASDPAAN